ncbi:MAG: hypothetical protein ABSE82_14745, partial [Nitrososphaerales archaeon]
VNVCNVAPYTVDGSWPLAAHPLAKKRREGWGTQAEEFVRKGWATCQEPVATLLARGDLA